MNGFTPDDGAERMTRLDEIRYHVEHFIANIKREDAAHLLTLIDTLTADLEAALAANGHLSRDVAGLRQIWVNLCYTLTEISGKNTQCIPNWNTPSGQTPSESAIAYIKELAAERDQLRAERDDLKELARINSELLATERAQVATHEAEVARLRASNERMIAAWRGSSSTYDNSCRCACCQELRDSHARTTEALTPGALAGDIDAKIQARVDSARPTNALLDMEIGM